MADIEHQFHSILHLPLHLGVFEFSFPLFEDIIVISRSPTNMYISTLTTIYLLAVPTVLSAVTGELRAPVLYEDDRVQLCTDLRPTECCRAIAGTNEYFKTLTLRNLPDGAISAAFRQSGNAKGCDGKPLQVTFRSGEFSFQSRRGSRITGGTYIVCSARSGPTINRIAFLNSRCPVKRRSLEEDVQMEEHAAEPGDPEESSNVYADVVRINGTEYHEDLKGSLVYRDKDGVVLDMNWLK